MPQPQKVSKFAAKLEELGFGKIPLATSENIRKVLPRNERRRIRSGKLTPTFTASEIITYVTDEFGQSWSALGNRSKDLEPFQFIDHSKDVMAEIKSMRQRDPRYN